MYSYWFGFCGLNFSMYRSSTSEMALVKPQAMYWLCPITIPGAPGKLAPITSISPATRWHSYQTDGAACSRCGSLQRMGEPVVVIAPSATQLLLPPSIRSEERRVGKEC